MASLYQKDPNRHKLSQDKYAGYFKDNLNNLLQYVKDVVTELIAKKKISRLDTLDIDNALLGIKLIPATFAVTTFIDNCHTPANKGVWDRIYNKEEDYFLQNLPSLFPKTPAEVFDKFKVIYRNAEEEDKDYLWQLVHALIMNAVCFVHYSKYPAINPDTNKRCYVLSSVFSEVNMSAEYKTWKPNVTFE